MKVFGIITSLVFISILSCGCSTISSDQAQLTYRTSPPGATIYEGELSWGLAPQTRLYRSITGTKIARTKEVTAVWPSGAKTTYFTDLPIDGRTFEVTISRPLDTPGIDKDWEWAASLERSATAKADADRAASDAAFRAFLQGYNSSRKTTVECWDYGAMIKCK